MWDILTVLRKKVDFVLYSISHNYFFSEFKVYISWFSFLSLIHKKIKRDYISDFRLFFFSIFSTFSQNYDFISLNSEIFFLRTVRKKSEIKSCNSQKSQPMFGTKWSYEDLFEQLYHRDGFFSSNSVWFFYLFPLFLSRHTHTN